MYTLKSSASFDSAHFLAGYHGKCSNIHGHHWIIEAEIRSDTLQEDGEKRDMLIDFGDFKRILHGLADSFDHRLIYETGTLKEKTLESFTEEGFCVTALPFRPTAENFARYFHEYLRNHSLPVYRVTVYETPENCASYEV